MSGCNTGRDCVDAHARIAELEDGIDSCNAVAAELATKYDRHGGPQWVSGR